MMRLVIAEPDDPAWRAWRKKCVKKTNEAIKVVKAGGSPAISELYKEPKEKIFNLFSGRCAYCERSTSNHQGAFPGDVEHYRPKGRVRDEQGAVVTRTLNGTSVPHPGYYWLAYDWTNLLLACGHCNRPSGDSGKHDRFPVVGNHAWEPGEEADEEPLLLNPVFDDPSEHIGFDPENGTLYAREKSKRGRATINILGLNSGELPLARATAYKDARSRFRVEFGDRNDLVARITATLKEPRNFQSLIKRALNEEIEFEAGRSDIEVKSAKVNLAKAEEHAKTIAELKP